MPALGGSGRIDQTIVIDADVGGATRDLDKVNKGLRDVDTSTDKAAKSGQRMGRVMDVAMGVGLVQVAGAAVRFGKDSVNAFRDAEASMASAEAMLDKNNKGWRAHKGEIDDTIKKHMDLSKFDDEDLYKSFANLARVTGSTTKATQLQGVAMDVARARGMSLEQATNLVTKAHNGQGSALKKLGIVLDRNATGTQAVAALQDQFGGSAARYGKSAAGAADAMDLAWGNFQEDIGKLIIPAVTALSGVLVNLLGFIQSNKTLVGVLVAAMGALVVVLGTIKAGLALHALWLGATTGATGSMTAAQWLLNAALNANPIGVVVLALAALAAGLVLAYKYSGTFRKLVQGALGAVQTAAEAVLDFFKKHWATIAMLISGPFAPLVALATDAFGIRSALVGAVKGAIAAVSGAASGMGSAAKALATAAWTGFKSVAWDVATLVRDRLITPMVNTVSTVLARGQAWSTALVTGIKSVAWAIAALVQERVITPLANTVGTLVTKGADMSSAVVRGIKSVAWAIGDLVQDRVITPLRDQVGNVITRGKAFGTNLIEAMGSGAREAWSAAVDGFKSVLNRIIGVLNRIPFVNIPKLAQGAVLNRPTLAVVGEDGPEVVVPVGRKRKTRGQALLRTAAMMLAGNGGGDGPGDNRNLNTSFLARMGIPMFADGAVYGGGIPASNYAALQVGLLRAKSTEGWGEQLMGFARNTLGNLVGQLPVPSFANPVLQGGANYVREQAVAVIKGIEAKKDQWALGSILAAQQWAQAQMGKGYVWGGGHGGWNFNLPGYDCSGFSSHAAKKAGSTLGAPGTTMSLINGQVASRREPMYFGLRGMGGGPREQHMGTKILGTWYQFGDPGHTGGTDGQWSHFRMPPGLPAYRLGAPYVPATGPAVLHAGEAVLPRVEAAQYRAGRLAPNVTVVLREGMGWLAEFIEAQVDGVSERARTRALAGGVL